MSKAAAPAKPTRARIAHARVGPMPRITDPAELTPVERRGAYWFKRDDLFGVNGVCGGKVRTCLALAQRAAAAGLVTAGSRASPQVNIVAHVAQHLGIPARCHLPNGELSPEVVAARAAGAELVQHKAGYNNVIIARARADARASGWLEIPFGMECAEAVTQTRRQVGNLPPQTKRLVIPVGSGMSLAGVLWGLRDSGRDDVAVVGIIVGADPTKRLDAHAPTGWERRVTLIESPVDYHAAVSGNELAGVRLDPHYEAKCVAFLEPGDLFWVVGVRATMRVDPAPLAIGATRALVTGNAAEWVAPHELKPWPRNPRKNDGEPVAKVAESIKRFGFGAPIVARKATSEIIAGHTRWKAAQQLGLERVPVRFLDISESEAHLLALSDNRLGELAEWDVPELRGLLDEYEMPDIALAGWSEADVAQLAAAEQPEEDEASGEQAGVASFGLFSAAAITDALVPVLLGKRQADFAPTVPDVMVALNRCAAGRGAALSRLTDRWFPHRYDVLAGTARQTPNEQLQAEKVIRAAVKMTTGVLKQWGSVREVVNAILLCQGQCARQFPIVRARDIYREFSYPEARVLDPCAGWGGRLLGWLCTQHGGSYEGFDAAAATVEGFGRMTADLQIANATVTHAAYEDVRLKPETFDFAFTSPPYFTLERYGQDAEQAEVRYPTYAEWRAGFLAPLIGNTLAALRPGCAFAVNVSAAAGNDLARDVVELAGGFGAAVEKRSIDIGTHYKMYLRVESEIEDLLVLRKPGKAKPRGVAV